MNMRPPALPYPPLPCPVLGPGPCPVLSCPSTYLSPSLPACQQYLLPIYCPQLCTQPCLYCMHVSLSLSLSLSVYVYNIYIYTYCSTPHYIGLYIASCHNYTVL